MSMRILRTIGLLTLMMPQVLQAEPSTLKAETKDILLETFQEAVRGNDFDKAEKAATDLIKLETEHPELAYSRRAKVYLAQDKFAEAASDLAEVAKLNPTPSTINDLGSIRYQAGQLREALTDFDRAIKLEPRLEAGHWQRGIVYYDLGQWENGRKQFEQYQGVDDNDVENVVWRAMCMARDPKLGWEKASGDLWRVKHDRRVPLMVVHHLFADKATEADVLKAVDEGNPGEGELLSRRFYAHLYLGLYHEVRGNNTEALKHLELASGKYKLPGYMAEVARVHVDLLKKQK
jgi:tetratricopeptide (TPR) repeat protein